ncbi:MAG: homoserine dehydrogenase [Armatimonadetes bacterium]|nr:homoserine dehydrogenase [Armatimonadota bacterium]MDW8120827.1 homoserine dehydrogenase [Armatimonadota bacterium]
MRHNSVGGSKVSQSPPVLGLGFLGMGTVGCGAARILLSHHDVIAHRIRCGLKIVQVAVRNPNKERAVSLPKAIYTTDPFAVVNNPAVDIVVEVMGGLEPAYQCLMTAIQLGKSVVTANKELLAKKGSALLDAARERGADVFFEGSVAGGIPIITALKQSLAGEKIHRIVGILNGTTNFILTRMARDHQGFAETLREAQEKGFAEADPSDDVEGRDAAYKLAIISAIAFGFRIAVDRIHREGITNIELADVRYAEELGYSIKLIASARKHNGQLELRVHPALVPKTHPLASVSDNYNAVLVEGENVGRLMFYGQGAGGAPTGNSVVADIMDAARNIVYGSRARIVCTCRPNPKIRPIDEVESRFCMRMDVLDRPGVLAKIASVFAHHNVSISSVVQRESHGDTAEIVWITHPAPYASVKKALAEISDLDVVSRVRPALWVEPD